MVKYRPLVVPSDRCHNEVARTVGARPMAGRLTLDQLIEVRILCPQPKTSHEGSSLEVRTPIGGHVLCPQPKALALESLFFRVSNPLKGISFAPSLNSSPWRTSSCLSVDFRTPVEGTRPLPQP